MQQTEFMIGMSIQAPIPHVLQASTNEALEHNKHNQGGPNNFWYYRNKEKCHKLNPASLNHLPNWPRISDGVTTWENPARKSHNTSYLLNKV